MSRAYARDMTDGAARAGHWDLIYKTRDASEVSWYQPFPEVSVALIGELGIARDVPVIDVGGGESMLIDELVGADFADLTVLDVSSVALADGRRRLGDERVTWLEIDVLDWQPERRYGLWHDRAVFHFLVDQADRAAYIDVLRRATGPASAVIVATFGPDGPESCSGLPVTRYTAQALAAELGEGFEVMATREERHSTPAGDVQPFTWVAGRMR